MVVGVRTRQTFLFFIFAEGDQQNLKPDFPVCQAKLSWFSSFKSLNIEI